MNVTVEKLEKSMAKLTIEVSAEDFDKAIDSVYRRQRNKMNIPGFRKGKAPRKLLEMYYGTGVFLEDAVNETINSTYPKAAQECEISSEISSNPEIAVEIEQVNRRLLDEGTNYIIIGPGRWGSSDPWLGIPVKWPHISAARVIVESGLKNYRVDPSQGTHFFQNLTSFGVGYFTINTYKDDGVFQKEVLDQMPAVSETQYVRHVRFDRPLKVMMDGKKQEGIVLQPE